VIKQSARDVFALLGTGFLKPVQL
jgi:hypothetical protein